MLTVRMNWMDVDKSHSADVQLSKDSKDIPVYHRNKLYHHRAQVASMIRQQLAIIQRELNGDDDDQTEETKATEAITALIKGQRYRDGKLYTCYLDGTSHEGCETVTAYNTYCRQRLDNLLAANTEVTAKVPDAGDFDVAAIDDMLGEEADLAARSTEGDEEAAELRVEVQKKIDAARKTYNDKATKCSRYLNSFVAIRNAKLSEGFDASTIQSRAVTARKPVTARAESPVSEDDAELLEEATGPEDEGVEESVLASSGAQDEDELDAPHDEAVTDEVPEADEAADEDSNAEIIAESANEDLPPTMRDGTVALNATVAPNQ